MRRYPAHIVLIVHGIALAVYRVVSIVPFFVPIGPVIVFIVIVHVPMVSGFVSW